MKIVFLEKLRIGNDIDLDMLNELGEVVIYDETSNSQEARERTQDADIIVVDQMPCCEEYLANARNLKFITMTSTGTNFVDFDYTRARGIKVANIRNYSTHSVAQHTFALLFYLYEKLSSFDSYVRSGSYIDDFSNSSFQTTFGELYGKTWGIVGLGNIGREVAQIAAAFGCTIIYYSPSDHAYPVPYKKVDFDTLLETSDIISVHTPLTPQTQDLFNYEAFTKMKPTAYFVNSARGGLVDETALSRALTEHQIQGAALDVLKTEPMAPDCPLRPNLTNPNLFITPHIGWAGKESRQKAIQEVYKNIKAYQTNEPRNLC
ncbi:MAG: hydroxyacid dehydrogenase [Clostridia bacterium]|nr:hydroxyacid dehydrogenase [Clostridia bacterium]